ncbi:MAG: DedA family protein [Bacteroidota bacterium]|nr:DedA family protein [Bacteroidota bacterium]
MPHELVIFILKYGYLAIFILVFTQEVGLPNPIPNEFVLIFSGYLIFLGLLKLPLMILAAVLADFAGASILHTVFYFSGGYILKHKPRWLPISVKAIDNRKMRVSRNGLLSIYIGRLTPFIRGYTSVIAGLLQIRSIVFLPVAMITASIWATVYVSAGILLGPFWNRINLNIYNMKYIMMIIFTTVLLAFITCVMVRRYRAVKINKP